VIGDAISIRTEVVASDAARIRALAIAAGNFNTAEVEIAEELVRERVARGDDSGYHFVIAERAQKLLGYACYGPIPGTMARYDLYWVVVGPDAQRQGLGRDLVARVECAIRVAGGTRLYVDTSTSNPYAAARALYASLGYCTEAILRDFYADGDDKVVFLKLL
jgi:ribosomal protein S18 acetylase RimI-like enzyme